MYLGVHKAWGFALQIRSKNIRPFCQKPLSVAFRYQSGNYRIFYRPRYRCRCLQ